MKKTGSVTMFLVFALLVALCMMPAVKPVQAAGDIKIMIDGNELHSDTAPLIIEGRVLLPMRVLFEKLGADISWNGLQKTAIAKRDRQIIRIIIGNKTALVNDKPVQLDVPACIENNRTMIPLRFAAENLGAQVQWDDKSRIVHVGVKKDNSIDQEETDTQVKNDNAVSYVSGSKLLDDTVLEYAKDKSTTFKSGTIVEFSSTGYVKTGTLANISELGYSGEGKTTFAAGQVVEFNTQGLVTSGTLAEVSELTYSGKQAIKFKASPVKFNNAGLVVSGVLAENTELKYMKDTLTLFAAGREVEFFNDGTVCRGTVQRDSYMQYNSDVLEAPAGLSNTNGNFATFQAGTEVQFYQGGMVKQGKLLTDTSLPISFNRYLIFKADTMVFNEKGYVNIGILREAVFLPYRDDKNLQVKPMTKIVINSKGLLDEVELLQDESLEYKLGHAIEFRAGTRVKFNNNGYVYEGIPKNTEKLGFNLDYYALVQGGSEVSFRSDGYLRKFVLGDKLTHEYAIYSYGTTIEFGDNGRVISGTIFEEAKLPLASGLWVIIKEGSVVNYDSNGYLTRGTLKYHETLPFSFDKVNANVVVLKGDCELLLNERGYVKSGTLQNDSLLSYAQGQMTTFKANTAIEFYSSGYVKKGTLKNDTILATGSGRTYSAAAGTLVNFGAQGYLEKID